MKGWCTCAICEEKGMAMRNYNMVGLSDNGSEKSERSRSNVEKGYVSRKIVKDL